MNPPTSFDRKLMPHLHELAEALLAQKMYGRLTMVSSILAGFSAGDWHRIGDDEREAVVTRLADAFHVKAWDDWPSRDRTLSTIVELIQAEQRALRATG